MSTIENIISSFKLQPNLNPKIWSESGETMNPKVRLRLLEIAEQFIEYLKVDILVSDIIMTGSLANYNWSNYSDVDLHVVCDFSQFDESQLPLYQELFKLKKTLYNDQHDIKIFGYDVELYVQDESEPHASTGVYSVLYDEWINKPKKESVTIDQKSIERKSKDWMKTIDMLIENLDDESIEEAKTMISKMKEKIKKYRTSGLQKGGEYSDENLVFKVLRRNGYIQKLFDFEKDYINKKLSLDEKKRFK